MFSKKEKRMILIAVLVVILGVSLIVVAMTHNKTDKKSANDETVFYGAVTDVTTVITTENFDNYSIPNNNNGAVISYDGFEIRKEGDTYRMYYQGNLDRETYGLFQVPTANTPYHLIYFKNGEWDKTFEGIDYADTGDNVQYYVKNGVVASNYTGFYKHDGFRYYIKDGIFKRDENGTVVVDGQSYKLARGIVQDDF